MLVTIVDVVDAQATNGKVTSAIVELPSGRRISAHPLCVSGRDHQASAQRDHPPLHKLPNSTGSNPHPV